MNSGFQILDKSGQPMKINDIDREICELIGNEYDDKRYCVLGKRSDYPEGRDGEWKFISSTSNWYDTIGWMIASENKSFQDIIDYYAEGMKDFIGKPDDKGVIVTVEYCYPYHTKVLNHFIAQGYTPKQVINA